MLLPGRIYIALGPWHFGDFRNIFLPNRGEDQKSRTISARRAPYWCNELQKKRVSSPGVLTKRVLPWFEFFFIQK